jgi:hypothetical protein
MLMFRALLVAAAGALAVGWSASAQPSLTPADIEKVTGLHGIHLLVATAPGAVPGRDSFADGDGRVVLWFQTMNAAAFARAKEQPAKIISGIPVEPKFFHAAVTGMGDEAFDSPDATPQHALYVRRKDAAFGLISNVTLTNVPIVGMDQLKAIAKVVLSRM